MQTSISMPSVLKAVVTLKMWLSNENEFASSLMEESVSNQQCLSVLCFCTGLMMFPFLLGTLPIIGIIGLALLIVGSFNLAE